MSKEFISVTICDIKELPIQVGIRITAEITIDVAPVDSVLDLYSVTSFRAYYNKQTNAFEANILQVNTLGGIIYIQRDPSTFASELKAINS